jgi:surface antigen
MFVTTRIIGLAAVSSLALASPALSIDPNAAQASANDMPVDSGERRGFLSGVLGCSASGNKQTGGAVIGGALGGLLGNRIAGRGSRTLGTILGGALGAAAGSAVGCKLQKNDQAKAEAAMEEAIATGENQEWENPETGASGRVEVGRTTSAGIADLGFAKGVEPADRYTKVGAAFVSTAAANIRSRPGTDGKIVGTLTSGQRVWVPASVAGAPWYLISDQGTGLGYVSNALLKRDATQTAAACRMVKQTVEAPGAGSASESYQACQGKDGQWVLTRV